MTVLSVWESNFCSSQFESSTNEYFLSHLYVFLAKIRDELISETIQNESNQA